jgi:hypothetical protein
MLNNKIGGLHAHEVVFGSDNAGWRGGCANGHGAGAQR